jgi:thiamine pyrophosphokinase
MHALVVADGEVPDRSALDAAWPGWDEGVSLVVGADGGALRIDRLDRRPDIVVGDGDSLDPSALEKLRREGIEVRLFPTDKDESDTEIAVTTAISMGATRITVLGAFGGRRFDHALANVALLALPAVEGRPMILLDQRTRVRLLTGPAQLDLGGPIGDLVSLLPFGADVDGVVTRGLRYPLRDETLRAGPARGLSNVREEAAASVAIRSGRLLVVESPATLPR